MAQPSQAATNPHQNEEDVVPVPQVGDWAPTLGETVQFPREKPVVVVFLRHCGCPFAEKTFKLLTDLSNHHPELHCVAISQAGQEETDKWVVFAGGEWEVEVLFDPQRTLFHAWGLGLSSAWYAVNPMTLWHTWKLGTDEGIWEELSKLTTTYPHNRNRNTGSGSRWQIGGAFAVDAGGFVRWSRPATSADDVPDFGEALRALGGHWGMAP